MSMEPKIGVVILAAGDGKRMKSDTPKVLHLLRGKPLVAHVVDAVEKSGLTGKPVVVVSANHRLVQNFLADRVTYVIQQKQLGTGNAVAAVESALKNSVDHVVVLYGDMPFIKSGSIVNLVKEHTTLHNTITLMTVIVSSFEDGSQFYDFGRVVRDDQNDIVKIVERKDATPDQLKVTEVNTSLFCFKASWLWKNIKKIQNNNKQGEYYLTDLIQFAIKMGQPLSSVPIDPREAIGINTKEQLDSAEKI